MARKGQKFNKYSSDFKEEILNEYFKNGINTYELERKYGVPHKTIQNWVHRIKYKLGGPRGRPRSKSLTLEDYKERYEILKKYQAFLQARREKK